MPCRLGSKGHQLFESNVDIPLKFLHNFNLESTGWLRMEQGFPVTERATTCDQEYRCLSGSLLSPMPGHMAMAPFVVASYDIECISTSPWVFVDASKPGDKIIQIATTYQRMNEELPYKKVLFALGKCAPVPNCTATLSFSSERELLLGWARSIQSEGKLWTNRRAGRVPGRGEGASR